jgi:hypothetical protein
MRHLLAKIGPCLFLALVVSPALADVIDFQAQTVASGGNITGIPDSPLTIGIATFIGGELLNGEVGLNADQTGVYATEGLFGSGETNPLVINFASPVSNFSIYVANADSVESYTVSDNLGDSATMSLASASASGAATFSLPGDGLTIVYITSTDTNAWDFAIDNVTFTEATSAQEPAAPLLFGAGFIAMFSLRRKQLIAWLAVND